MRPVAFALILLAGAAVLHPEPRKHATEIEALQDGSERIPGFGYRIQTVQEKNGSAEDVVWY